MHETLVAKVRRLAADSAILSAAAAIRSDGGIALALGDAPLRQLHKSEIVQLVAQGNTAQDWFRVRVAAGFSPRRVRNCEFRGEVVLGVFDETASLTDRVEVETGISNCTLADCVIGNNAVIRDVRLLANYVVGSGAVVVDCGRINCTTNANFGNGARVPVALEVGGRDVDLFAEMDVELAAAVARPGSRRCELDAYRVAVAEYRLQATADRGVIEADACIMSVPRIEDSYIGTGVRIDGAAGIARCTLLSSTDEPVLVGSGALLSDSLVQWGCRVTSHAIVEQSLLIEYSSVERHGKVKCSVIGPNTEVAAGEVISCLLGPLVGCHHQSLLISTYWPRGRGNIGYGANIGSNHTSRAPDQEFRAGEGLFIGLGVNIKFPCDLSSAPYSVIACGTDLAPQRITFPFSLIAPAKEHFPGLPEGLNQITPAWMLRDNVYALMRSEAKFLSRYRARRNRINSGVFRPDTIEQMRAAVRLLSGVEVEKPFYTENDISGLGKNVLTDTDRRRAIDSYRFHICYSTLLALRDRVRDLLASRLAVSRLLTAASTCEEWEQQRHILTRDFGIEDPAAGLRLLGPMAVQIARNCERARERDDARGVRIIDDYLDVHPPADRDCVVQRSWDVAERLQVEIQGYLKLIASESILSTPRPRLAASGEVLIPLHG